MNPKTQHIIIASDSWKGTLTSRQANAVIARWALVRHPDAQTTEIEVSDGGEGFAHAVSSAAGGRMVEVECHDALLRPVSARYALLPDGTAVMDVASTVGLTMLRAEERDPWAASSRGVGEMIAAIVSRDAPTHIVVGLGGSATNDCGRGMMEVLQSSVPNLASLHFTIASDVDSPLCGPRGATYMFAKQKGATEAMLPALERRNQEYGQWLEAQCHRPITDRAGAGAAGGLGAAFMAMEHVEFCSGIDYLLTACHFDDMLSQATLVITGEGRIDPQTLRGKAPYGIALRAKAHGVPCIALCGQLHPLMAGLDTPWDEVVECQF